MNLKLFILTFMVYHKMKVRCCYNATIWKVVPMGRPILDQNNLKHEDKKDN